VTASITLYAKFTDTLTQALDALTFELISGGNANAQSVMTDLELPTSLTAYPGVTITWESSAPSVVSATGTVTRPDSGAADAEVTLKATLSLDGRTLIKTFELVVRKVGFADIEITGTDERFAPGYPKISIGNDGKATITIMLDNEIASAEHPVIAYLSLRDTSINATFDRDSVIFNHVVPEPDPDYVGITNGYDGWAVRPGEIVITDSTEYSYKFDIPISYRSPSEYLVPVFGIVLLADDDISDENASATVIKLTYEELEYVDLSPPWIYGAILNNEKNKLYLHVYDSVALTVNNMPSASDFALVDMGSVSITEVNLKENLSDFAYTQVLEFTLSGAAVPGGNAKITYTPSAHPLTDINGNNVNSPIEAYITSANHEVKLFVNPASGTAMLTFEPAISQDSTYTYLGYANIGNYITIEYKGNSVGELTFNSVVQMGYGSGDKDKLGFTFTPINDSNVNPGDFTFSIDSELLDAAYEPYNTTDKPAEQILSIAEFGPGSVTATYDGSYENYSIDSPATAGIVVTFPQDCVVKYDTTSLKALACEFTLTVDGKRVAYRYLPTVLWETGNVNKIVLPLSARLDALVQDATTITLTYTPNIHDTDNKLADITGAFLPAFGPVTVTVTPGD
jgi:hypothetical protein